MVNFLNNAYENLYEWYQESKSKYSGRELTKQLNLQVKYEMGEIMSNSIVIQSNYEGFAQLFAKYGIVIKAKEVEF